MAAVAKNPAFAKKVGVPRSVGEEFLTADKGKKFREGGTMKDSKAMAKKEMHSEKGEMKMDVAQDKKLIKKAFGMHDKQSHEGKKTDLSSLKKGGMTKMARGGGIETKGKTKGKMIAMCGGGMSKKK